MNNTDAQNETLRLTYAPEKVRVLFVGESQPKGPQFFYNEKRGKVADNFRKALPHLAGADPQEFLANFQAAGFYLTDLVKVAVNAGAVTPKERARLCRKVFQIYAMKSQP